MAARTGKIMPFEGSPNKPNFRYYPIFRLRLGLQCMDQKLRFRHFDNGRP